jgi:hypothetical protein
MDGWSEVGVAWVYANPKDGRGQEWTDKRAGVDREEGRSELRRGQE